ncbi:hypothetical protein [Thermocatellispora tengchongensis]|uniref:hypothetical protein n=1 Tax=Thermocatellispora tengchongensis TaxID=1073253 RepID=UPI003640E39B
MVFRGVNTAIGPVQLYQVARATGLSVSALTAVQQGQVRDGIPVASLDEGLKRIDELAATTN